MNLKFCFKGERKYVQGPDIVAKLFDTFSESELENIDIKFNGITSTNLTLEKNSSEAAKVHIRIKDNGEEKDFQLIENNEPIDCRHEYDEQKIIDKVVLGLEVQEISLTAVTGFTVCENFVAMNKYLLQSLYPDEKGKWYFTRLQQKKVIDNDSLITVRLIKNFNFRLTKSDILLDGEVVGSVYFTMVK